MTKSKILLLLLLVSCSPAKRLERKQSEAISTVLASNKLLNEAGEAWLEVHPCVNDTSKPVELAPIFLKGKDSVYPVYIPFTNYKYRRVDTMIEGNHFAVDSLGNIYARFKVSVPDTVRVPFISYVKDGKLEDILRKHLIAANDSLLIYRNALVIAKKAETKIKILIAIFSFAAIVIIFLRVKLKSIFV
jgi:hypothetical protein